MADYEHELDVIWRDLGQHLDYAAGFLLILLYTRHPAPARELLRRAESLLQARGLKPLLLRPRDAAQAHSIVQTVIAARPEPGGERPAIWLDLWGRSSDADWQTQRYEILARLNERRFLLEQRVGRPLVLILPEADRGNMHILAPDLWTVRSYSMGLPVPEGEDRRTWIVADEVMPPAANQNFLTPGESEWLRMLAAVPEAERANRLDPRDGIGASQAALERGALAEAKSHAEVALCIARVRLACAPDEHNRRRVLSLALDTLGQVRRAAGDLEAARAAFTESLKLRQQLHAALGDLPQVLRDLSISFENVGLVFQDLGDLESARSVFMESLELARQLRETRDATPQALRDLSIVLDKVGDVSLGQVDLDAARAAYVESLELARQLRLEMGDTPQALRDLSISLNKVGHVSLALGDLETARAAYVESLALCRQLRAVQGDTPAGLDGLAHSLRYVGQLQVDLHDPAAARAAFQEAADLAARLVALQPDHPGYRALQAQLQADLEKLPP